MLSFKPTFSLFSFTLIKRPFSSSLFAIKMVSSAYLRLLLVLLAILIPACASYSPVFLKISRLTKPIRAQQTSMFYSNIDFLICVNETIYLLGNLPFLKIHANRFMAWDDSPCASVISICMLWARGLGPF